MTEKTTGQPESALVRAMKTGKLGGAGKRGTEERKMEKSIPPAPTKPVQQVGKLERRRLTAYLSPAIHQWTKVQAAKQDREISEIVEEALKLLKRTIEGS